MRYWLIMLSLLLSTNALAEQGELIEVKGHWAWAEHFIIGEQESGFFGVHKENRQVRAALEIFPESKRLLGKARYFDYVGWATVIAIIASSDPEEGESFDEDPFLVGLPILLGLSYGRSHYMNKAVDIYNMKISSGLGSNGKSVGVWFAYKF